MLCPRCKHALDDHTWSFTNDAALRPCLACEKTKGLCRDGRVLAHVRVGQHVNPEQIRIAQDAAERGFIFGRNGVDVDAFNAAVDWLCDSFPEEFVHE